MFCTIRALYSSQLLPLTMRLKFGTKKVLSVLAPLAAA